MLSYIQWIEQKKFRVREYWDEQASVMKQDGGILTLLPFQKKIMGTALEVKNGRIAFNDILYSTIKKSGKTTLAASVGAWVAEEFPAGSEIYVIANDLEQANARVMQDIKYHAQQGGVAYVTQNRIEYPNGTFVQSLAQHYKSAAGARQVCTLWDELHGYTSEASRRMWSEMTLIPTNRMGFRFVATYAGFEGESDLLWEKYLQGVGPEEHKEGKGEALVGFDDLPVWSNGRMFTYWDHEPRMPWQDDEFYENEKNSSRPADYLRLNENRWVTSHEAFIDPAWWDFAAKSYPQSAELWDEHPYRFWPVHIGVDIGIKHDSSAVVGVAYDARRGKVAQVFHHIWTPKGDEINLEVTVEAYLRAMYKRFIFRMVSYDPYQFARSAQTLQAIGMPMQPFDQTTGNMTPASQQLFDLLRGKKYETYPDPETKFHISNAVAKDTGRGFRIVKDPIIANNRHKRGTKPIDFAIATAIAAYTAVQSGGIDTSQPLIIRSPFGDVNQLDNTLEAELALPGPLRSDY